jgi:hypothetical protein
MPIMNIPAPAYSTIAGAGITIATATTRYTQLGGNDESGGESNVQIQVGPGVIKGLRSNCTANTWTGATAVTLRLNGADTALTTTITASTTGIFVDNTHSVPVALNDLIDLAYTTATGTGSITVRNSMVYLANR